MTIYVLFEMNYKPYTIEWSRKRYLNEAIQKYFESDVEPKIIIDDIIDCLTDSISYHKNMKEKIQMVLNSIEELCNE